MNRYISKAEYIEKLKEVEEGIELDIMTNEEIEERLKSFIKYIKETRK